MQIIFKLAFPMAVFLLASCSSQITTTAERDYVKAVNGPKLQVLAPLSNTEINHYYDLPEPATPYSKVSIEPPGINDHM